MSTNENPHVSLTTFEVDGALHTTETVIYMRNRRDQSVYNAPASSNLIPLLQQLHRQPIYHLNYLVDQ